MMEETDSSETSVLIRAIWCNIPEDVILDVYILEWDPVVEIYEQGGELLCFVERWIFWLINPK
jgi:hypothetical protein